MHKIEIKLPNKKINFGFSGVKYILGNNIELKYDIKKTIQKHFYNIDHSEFDLENSIQTSISIDDRQLDIKKWKFYQINEHMNFMDEVKMGTKTLSNKFIESLLSEIDIDERLLTINHLLDDLSNDMKTKIPDDRIKFSTKFQNLNQKTLTKLVELLILDEEDLKMNLYNLSYNEIIQLQIGMIEYIAKINNAIQYIVIIDIPNITPKLQQDLSKSSDNIHYFVFINHNIHCALNDVCFIGKKVIDFSNDALIYNEITMDLPIYLTLEELKVSLNNLILGIHDEITLNILKLI